MSAHGIASAGLEQQIRRNTMKSTVGGAREARKSALVTRATTVLFLVVAAPVLPLSVQADALTKLSETNPDQTHYPESVSDP
jgi:hypothetical protein